MKTDLELVKKFCKCVTGDYYITVEESDEFSYWYQDSRIEIAWPQHENPENSQLKADFIAYINSTYHIDISNKVDYFVFSLLHELGHHMTMDSLDETDLQEELVTRRLIELTENDSLYFTLPSELAANDWAFEHWDFGITEFFKGILREED